MQCFKCSTEVPILGRVGFREECFKCGSDLHCCRNCDFFDPKLYNECREPQADRVTEKDRSNLCEFFSPLSKGRSDLDERQKQLDQAEALFRKK